MRVLRVIGLVLSSVVLLVIGGIAARAGWQAHQAHRLHDHVARAVSARLVEAVPTARNERDRLVAAAGREPDREQLDQHCSFETDDAGWMVENNRQTCDLEGTLTWAASDRTHAVALATRVISASGETAEPPAAGGSPGCTVLDGTDLVVVVTARTCGYPSQLGLRPVQPARGDRVDGLRVEVRTTTSLGDYDLGCRTLLLFCDNPFDEPAYGSLTGTASDQHLGDR